MCFPTFDDFPLLYNLAQTWLSAFCLHCCNYCMIQKLHLYPQNHDRLKTRSSAENHGFGGNGLTGLGYCGCEHYCWASAPNRVPGAEAFEA
jgi:hypothetical protein